MKVTRIYRFAASHRLHSRSLSETANLELYGKCNNPYGHGHDYVLHVTASGRVSTKTGRLVDPGKLDRYVYQRLLSIYDHSDLNEDVPGFAGVPTTENLAVDATRRLLADWPFADVTLDRVLIQETDRNTIELRST